MLGLVLDAPLSCVHAHNNVLSATSGAFSDTKCADPGENGDVNFVQAFDRLSSDVTLLLSVI